MWLLQLAADMIATTGVRPRLAQLLRPTAATARTTRLQRCYASSDALARPWQRPDMSHWRVRLSDRDLKVAEELCIGPPFGEVSFSMHDPSQGPVITRDAHDSHMDAMLATFKPSNPSFNWQSQLEEDESFQVWRRLLERNVYPEYDLDASSIQGAIDQMAGFIEGLLEWEVDGYVLEEAEDGRIRTRPWWCMPELATRPNTDRAAAALAKTDTWLRSEGREDGARQSDTVGSHGPGATAGDGVPGARLTGMQELHWRWLADGASSLEEVRDNYRHEVALAMELQAAGYEVDCGAMYCALECRRPQDPVSSDEEDDWDSDDEDDLKGFQVLI